MTGPVDQKGHLMIPSGRQCIAMLVQIQNLSEYDGAEEVVEKDREVREEEEVLDAR